MHEVEGKGLSVQTAISKEELELMKKRRELMTKSKEELKSNVKNIVMQALKTDN